MGLTVLDPENVINNLEDMSVENIQIQAQGKKYGIQRKKYKKQTRV